MMLRQAFALKAAFKILPRGKGQLGLGGPSVRCASLQRYTHYRREHVILSTTRRNAVYLSNSRKMSGEQTLHPRDL